MNRQIYVYKFYKNLADIFIQINDLRIYAVIVLSVYLEFMRFLIAYKYIKKSNSRIKKYDYIYYFIK